MSTFGVFKRRKSNMDLGQKELAEIKISEKNLKNIFSDCGDYENRALSVEGNPCLGANAVWLDGLVNTIAVSEDLIRPFAMNTLLAHDEDTSLSGLILKMIKEDIKNRKTE